MSINPNTFGSILFVASLVSVVQSLTWMVLTIMGIFAYVGTVEPPNYNDDDFVLTTIVKLYFTGEKCNASEHLTGSRDLDTLMKPFQVFGWMIGLLIVSSMSFTLSGYLFIYWKKRTKNVKMALQCWCFLTFALLLMDASLTAMFLMDYFQLKDDAVEGKEDISKAPLIMSILSSRGFALWLFNGIQLLYFICCLCSKDSHLFHDIHDGGKGHLIHGYDNHTCKSTDSLGRQNFWSSSWSSSESLVQSRPYATQYPKHKSYEATRDIGPYSVTRDMAPYSLPREISLYSATNLRRHNETDIRNVNERRRRYSSEDSFEDVTAFNEVAELEIVNRPPDPPKKPATKARARDNAEKVPVPREPEARQGFCYPVMESELKSMLDTMRTRREQRHTQNLADFSHDIKNFKQGGGTVPESRSVPRAIVAKNSNF